jgi:hypothetical protein
MPKKSSKPEKPNGNWKALAIPGSPADSEKSGFFPIYLVACILKWVYFLVDLPEPMPYSPAGGLIFSVVFGVYWKPWFRLDCKKLLKYLNCWSDKLGVCIHLRLSFGGCL